MKLGKKGHQVCARGLFMFGEVELKNTFLFREPECDSVPELVILRQKIGLLVIVSRYKSTSTGYRGYPPKSLFNLVSGIQCFIREEHQ